MSRDYEEACIMGLICGARTDGVFDPSGPPVTTTPLPTTRPEPCDKCGRFEYHAGDCPTVPKRKDFRAEALRQGREREEAAKLAESKTAKYEIEGLRDVLRSSRNWSLLGWDRAMWAGVCQQIYGTACDYLTRQHWAPDFLGLHIQNDMWNRRHNKQLSTPSEGAWALADVVFENATIGLRK